VRPARADATTREGGAASGDGRGAVPARRRRPARALRRAGAAVLGLVMLAAGAGSAAAAVAHVVGDGWRTGGVAARAMRRAGAAVLGLVLLAAGAGSAAAAVVHVVSNGWHTGVVAARADLGDAVLPEAAALRPSGWLEFGWGDRYYYPNPRPSLADALGAGVTPGPAVLHVAPRDAPPAPRPGEEVVALALPEGGIARLAAALSNGVDRGGATRAEPVARGLRADSLFFPATGRFHLFSTCNTWVARVLRAAGLPVDPRGVVTAEQLMAQLRPLAVAH
jgi:hypothetical protein